MRNDTWNENEIDMNIDNILFSNGNENENKDTRHSKE